MPELSVFDLVTEIIIEVEERVEGALTPGEEAQVRHALEGAIVRLEDQDD